MRDFVARVCTGCCGLIRTYAARYRKWLNSLLSDRHLRVTYVGGYFICVGEDRYSLLIDEANNDKMRGDRSSFPKSGDHDIIEVVVRPLNPSLGAF